MKELIRRGVFETNSSSSHSISIAGPEKEFVLDTIYPDQDGTIILSGGEFGWGWFKHNDALTKANYVAASYGLSQDLVEAIKEQTGADEVVYTGTDDYSGSNWSYVDHDSVGVAPKSKEEIKDFIFNKNSWLFGGNDNSTADPTFYHVPEFRGGKQILPKYKYKLSVDGYSKSTKFLEYPTKEDISDALYSLLDDVYLTESGYFDDDNSIHARISRDRSKYFEFDGYSKPIDFEGNVCFFVRKDNYSSMKWLYEKRTKKYNWDELKYEERSKFEKDMYDDATTGLVKAVKFQISEI